MKKIALIILLITGLNAQEVLERIVAVVDNEVILKSELDYQVTVAAARGGLKADDPELQKKILNQLIEEKLLYAQAELDSITVSNEEVEAQLENQLGFFIETQNFCFAKNQLVQIGSFGFRIYSTIHFLQQILN